LEAYEESKTNPKSTTNFKNKIDQHSPSNSKFSQITKSWQWQSKLSIHQLCPSITQIKLSTLMANFYSIITIVTPNKRNYNGE